MLDLITHWKKLKKKNNYEKRRIRQANRLTAQIAVMKEIAVDYSGKTIDNIIQQLEAIKKEVENEN